MANYGSARLTTVWALAKPGRLAEATASAGGQTGAERQLGELTPEPLIGDFDVSRSGDEVVFDRTEERSEIALIERAH